MIEMKFEDNVQKLISILDSISSVSIVNSECDLADGSSEERSAGSFFIEFKVDKTSIGWDVLECVSRAIAVHATDSYFRFGFSVKNYKSSSVVFVLDWHDGTGNDGYIYDDEIAKLCDILQEIAASSFYLSR